MGMVLALKYQAKIPLSLTQPTAKYLARIHSFLQERACRAMAPRSLMVLIVIRQVRVFSPRVMGPSRIVLALSFLARVLSLNNQELKQTRTPSLTQLGHSCQARVLVSLKELERKDLGRISPSLNSSPQINRVVSLIHSLIVRILRFQVGGHHPIIGG